MDFLAQRSFQHYLSRDLEKHKAQLQRRNDREIVRLRADLRLEEFRFAWLHERRALVIAELYSRIARLHAACEATLTLQERHPSNPQLERARQEVVKQESDRARDCTKEFFEYFNGNRIYVNVREGPSTDFRFAEQLERGRRVWRLNRPESRSAVPAPHFGSRPGDRLRLALYDLRGIPLCGGSPILPLV